MKLAIVLVVSLAYLCSSCYGELTIEQFTKLTEYSKQCREKTGATLEIVTKALVGEFTDDPKLKSYLFCVSKKLKIYNEAGELNEQVLKQKLNYVLNDEAKTEAVIKKCTILKDTPEQTIYDSLKCYQETEGISLLH